MEKNDSNKADHQSELKSNHVETLTKRESLLKKRRAIFVFIAAAGAGSLPAQWKNPVVDHVI